MRPRRVGVVTAGGDCPGMNAVLRAVVKAAAHEHGIDDRGVPGWIRRPALRRRAPAGIRRRIRHSRPGRDHPRRVQQGRSLPRSDRRRLELRRPLGRAAGDALAARHRRVDRHRGRWQPPDRRPPRGQGRGRGGCAEDHRQRRHRDGYHPRLRLGAGDRHGGRRSPPHDGGVASPADGARGHGPQYGLDRPRGRHRGRRGRDPDPRGSVRIRGGCRGDPRSSEARPPVLHHRGGGGRDVPRWRHGGAPAREGQPGARPSRRGRRRGRACAGGTPAVRSALMSCSATSSGAARRPPSTAYWPRGSASPRSAPLRRAKPGCMVALRGSRIERVPLAESAGRTRSVDPAGERVQAARSVGTIFGDEPV